MEKVFVYETEKALVRIHPGKVLNAEFFRDQSADTPGKRLLEKAMTDFWKDIEKQRKVGA